MRSSLLVRYVMPTSYHRSFLLGPTRPLLSPHQSNHSNRLLPFLRDNDVSQDHQQVLYEVHQCLKKGPVRFSVILPQLSDDVRAVVNKMGGLDMFTQFHAKYFHKESFGNDILISSSLFRKSNGSKRLLGEIKETLDHFKGTPVSHKEIQARLSPIALIHFQKTRELTILAFLKAREVFFSEPKPGHFTLNPEGAKHLRGELDHDDGGGRNDADSRPENGSNVLLDSAISAQQILSGLRRCACFTSFVPLGRVYELMCEDDPKLRSLPIESLHAHVCGMPTTFLDVRILPSCPGGMPGSYDTTALIGDNTISREDKLEYTFLRIVGDNLKVELREEESGESRHEDYSLLPFAPHLLAVLSPMWANGPIPLAAIPSIVGASSRPSLLAELPIARSRAVRGDIVAVLPLVFDRMQHLFQLDLEAGVVRPAATGPGGIALTAVNTPTPSLLRAALHALSKAPLKPPQFEAAISDKLKGLATSVYGSLPKFVMLHRNKLFLSNGQLWTPALVSGAASAISSDVSPGPVAPGDGPSRATLVGDGVTTNTGGVTIIPATPIKAMSPKQLAEYIHASIPSDRCVSWMTLRGYVDPAVFRHSALAGDPREFFNTHSSLLDTYDPMFTNSFLVCRSGLPAPEGVWKEVDHLYDVLKEVAMICPSPESENTINNLISRDTRSFIKRVGGMEYLVGLVPEWFVVTNPSGLAGSALIGYIGHLHDPYEGRERPQLPEEDEHIPAAPEKHAVAAAAPNTDAPATDDFTDFDFGSLPPPPPPSAAPAA